MNRQELAEDLRSALIAAIMPHVPFDGWSDAALRAGAADAGIDFAVALNAFPGGMAEVLACNHRRHDAAMITALGRNASGAQKIRERIAHAVRLRLDLAAPHREAVRSGLSFLLLPQNAPLGPRLLYGTVDAIWQAIGDRSTDFSFYTKRALLAAIYSATLLFWLNDRSEGSAATWQFLDRRISEVMKIPQVKGQVKLLLDRLPNPLNLVMRGGISGGVPRRRLSRRV